MSIDSVIGGLFSIYYGKAIGILPVLLYTGISVYLLTDKDVKAAFVPRKKVPPIIDHDYHKDDLAEFAQCKFMSRNHRY